MKDRGRGITIVAEKQETVIEPEAEELRAYANARVVARPTLFLLANLL